MYKDTLGNVTVGIGCMLTFVRSAQALPFQILEEDRPANSDEIMSAYYKVNAMPSGCTPSHYIVTPHVQLTQDAIDSETKNRLATEFIPGLERMFLGWDVLPIPAREALVDIAWNIGVHGLSQFPHLLAAVSRHDWRVAAQECSVRGARPARTEYRKGLFLSCIEHGEG
jgi:GH24 family phage-related lysozyme (muramidase)